MPLGSLSVDRPFSKSLSMDFKRKENSKIMHDNSFLVDRIIKKKPFLPISKINRDFREHEKYLNRIRKMDATNNKMKVRGLEKLSNEKLKQLPHINEISRCLTNRNHWKPNKTTNEIKRSASCKELENKNHGKSAETSKRVENTHFSNEFLEEKKE